MGPMTDSPSGDPGRLLRLLWREPLDERRRGPSRALGIEAVVAAATELADAGGLDAVTMRAVAQHLRVGTMTLYTYAPGRPELVDLMLDAAYAELPRTDTSGQAWRARLTAIVAENRSLFARHPWAANVAASRPPLGPGLMAKYEHELGALDGLGLDDVEIDACLTYLLGFVQGWARTAADARAAQRESAMSDQAWWEAHEPLLARIFDAADYPLAVRVGSAAGASQGTAYEPEHAYRFGLERTLDGLAALIDKQP